jgi:hypothetical protein
MTVVRLPFMAHTRSAGMSVIPPLLEDKRTSRGEPISVAIDPNETLNPASVLNWQMLFVPRSTFEVAVVWIMRRTPSQAGQMRRRDFITALGTAATWPLAARAPRPCLA